MACYKHNILWYTHYVEKQTNESLCKALEKHHLAFTEMKTVIWPNINVLYEKSQ